MKLLIIAALVGVACSLPQEYFKKPEKTISESRSVGDHLREYESKFETEGGITQQEIGSRKYAGTKDETQLVQGSATWTAPDGTPVALSWTADEFGIKYAGTHLPTPPPVPIEIQRALEWLAKQPSTEAPDYNDDDNVPSKNVLQKNTPNKKFNKN